MHSQAAAHVQDWPAGKPVRDPWLDDVHRRVALACSDAMIGKLDADAAAAAAAAADT